MTAFQIAFECVLCVLLGFGIVYSIHLGRALTVLRRDRKELAELIVKLDESGRRAEDGVEKLQNAGEISGRTLSRLIDQSKMLHAELEALSERSDQVASRLEGLIRQGNRLATVEPLAPRAVERNENVREELLDEALPSRPPVRVPVSPMPAVPASGRPYEQRSRQRTAAEQDLIRALRMG